jgi:uncharacterized protein (TIGR02284 family)
MNNEEAIAILNNLIEVCRNGQDGFKMAAENVHDSEFRRLFHILSQQRAQFVSELQAEVHRLGGSPTDSSRAAGLLHRGWTKLKAAMARGEAGNVIAECQREEEAAVDSYHEALKNGLPLDVEYVVKRQCMDIQDAYDRIRILQRAA